MSDISTENLLESLFDGVYYVDLNRRITVWNSAAERLRVFIERSFLTTKEERLKVTVSIGATLVCRDDQQQTVLERADHLMYVSKNEGRNGVTCG